MNRKKHGVQKYFLRGGALAIAMLFPLPVFANQGLKGLGEAFQILICIVLVYVSLNLIISIANLHFKKIWLRFVNIILTIPLVLIAMQLYIWSALAGVIATMLIAIQGLIIYKSRIRNVA